MTIRRLIITEQWIDNAWLPHARSQWANPAYYWSALNPPNTMPRPLDTLGWFRWLKQHQIGIVEWFGTGSTLKAIAIAAALRRVNLRVHLPGSITPHWAKWAKLWQPTVEKWIAYDPVTEAALHEMRMDPRRITRQTLTISPQAHHDKAAARHAILHDSNATPLPNDARLVLALPSATHRTSLRYVLHAAALARYADSRIVVIRPTATQQEWDMLSTWQQEWKLPDLIHYRQADWHTLALGCDYILAGNAKLSDIAPWQSVSRTPTPIIATQAFLNHYGGTFATQDDHIRTLARCLIAPESTPTTTHAS